MSMSDQILLVDDDLDLLETVQESLEIRGYHIIIAHNGKEAIELYRQKIPCIVFMDIKMPEMDGYEAFSKIKKIFNDAKIVFLTGHEMTKKTQEAKNHGLIKIMNKPVATEEIVSTIKENDC